MTDSLRTGFFLTLGANIIYAACQWGTAMVLAKSGRPETVGLFALGLAIGSPIVLFLSMNLRGLLATDSRDQYQFSDYLDVQLVAALLSLVVIGVVIEAGGYDSVSSAVVLILAFGLASDAVSELHYGLFAKRHVFNWMAFSLIGKGLLSLSLSAVGLYWTRSVIWAAVGHVAGRLIVLLLFDLRIGRRTEAGQVTRILITQNGSAKYKTLIRTAVPLGIVGVLTNLHSNVPRYFIERMHGAHELGIFAALASFMQVGGMIVTAMGFTASPTMAKLHASGDLKDFRALLLKAVLWSSALGGAGVFVAAVAGRKILLLVYRPEYADRSDLLVWLMIAAGAGLPVMVLGYVLTAMRLLNQQVLLLTVVLGVNLTACRFFVQTWGAQGAAFAMLAATGVHLVGSLWLLRSVFQRNAEVDDGWRPPVRSQAA